MPAIIVPKPELPWKETITPTAEKKAFQFHSVAPVVRPADKIISPDHYGPLQNWDKRQETDKTEAVNDSAGAEKTVMVPCLKLKT